MAPDDRTPRCVHKWKEIHAVTNYGTGSAWYQECVKCGVQREAPDA